MASKRSKDKEVVIAMPGTLSDITVRRTAEGTAATMLVLGSTVNEHNEMQPDGFNGGFSMYATSPHLVRWLASLWANYIYDPDLERKPYRVELSLRIIDPRDEEPWPGTTKQ